VRIAIHVTPGASRTSVGGARGEALLVRVVTSPHRGEATAAALAAVADALAVPRTSVTLVRGATSRRKVVEVTARTGDPGGHALARRVAGLMGSGTVGGRR
jgi:uncharacterized protein YggU (UPF0235/DUF167 family)